MKKMANPFFEALGQRVAPNAPGSGGGPNIFAMAQQFKANPIGFLIQKKMHIAPNVNMNDPNAMLEYLVNSKQVPQSRVDWAKKQLSSLGGGR